ncbi:AlpA family transcriptional regulator [Paenarthrobacter nicotinovorans]|uniref:helix-turn-helix transcriptional regulator n=1 Tax=Paenarthrobacter nicotinovorans TaxID=29320 RepID=UPI00119F35E3|nr:hypothetical protein [Paenarthrobacter nicotinovorans]
MGSELRGKVSAAEFAERLGVKIASLYAYRSQDPQFPAGQVIGRMSYWTPREVDKYVEYRKTRRRGRRKGSLNKPKPPTDGQDS